MESTTAPLLFDSGFLAKLEQLHLLARKLFRGEHRAERRSRQIGSSLEFADYRNYAWGDEPRTIDWAVYARLDRLFVKLFEQERDLDVHFLIDSSASMRWLPEHGVGPSKFDTARRIAAALAYIALANLDRVNTGWFGAQLGDDLGLTRGRAQFHTVLEFLRHPPAPDAATHLKASLTGFAQRLKRRGLVFVLGDFFDPEGAEEALSVLRYHQFQTQIIQIIHPAELDPGLLGDVRLTDCESGAVSEVTATAAIVRAYRAEIEGYLARLESHCLRSGIGYALSTPAIPFEDLVLRILRDGVLLK